MNEDRIGSLCRTLSAAVANRRAELTTHARVSGCSAFIIHTSYFILACATALAQAPFEFKDNFATYPAGSDASPAWETTTVGWETGTGVFTCRERARDSAVLAAAPAGQQVHVETTLTVRETTTADWKVAGVCVARDATNFWHLALVEAPDAQGRKHFVELSEMLAGTWLAQSQPDTRLTATATQGGDFNWASNHSYRLVLDLTPKGISGEVREADGTVCAKLGYAFVANTRAVTAGKPGLSSGGFRTEFADFAGRVDKAVQVVAAAIPPTPPFARRAANHSGVKGKATGFFHLEETGGSWWAIDPVGDAGVIIGTDHVNYNSHWCEKLGYAPYNVNCEKRYGSEAKWAESTVARLHAWGFNSLGVNASPTVRHQGLPHFELLGLGTDFTSCDAITPRTTWTGFPNVFSPKFPLYCDKQARRLCAPHKDDPWLIGYFIDNELEWHAWTGGGPFVDAFKKPATDPAKLALVALLRARHPTVDSFNQSWGTTLKSLDELAALSQAPASATPAAQADVREFLRLIADKYFAITTAAIRKHDPHHMVLGCRFAGQAPDILDIAGKYCDVLSINCYRSLDLETGRMTDGFEAELQGWHEKAGRPVLITEWSFPALDAGLPCKHGAGQRVPTQTDKAFAFTAFQKLLLSTPYVLGSNYFMWADEPELGISSTFPEDSNYGLVDVNDKPYEKLTAAATGLHALAETIHAGRVADLAVSAGKARGSFVISNGGAAAAPCHVTFWEDGVAQARQVTVPAHHSLELAATAAVARPGGHFIACEVTADNPLLDKGTGNRVAHVALYTPGLPWPGDHNTRSAVLVSNPTDGTVTGAVVTIKLGATGPLPRGPAGVTVVDAVSGKTIRSQIDELPDGEELAIATGVLTAHTGRTLLLYPRSNPEPQGKNNTAGVKFLEIYRHNNKGGFSFDDKPGGLTLSKNDIDSGFAFDHISRGNVELGSFTPLIHQVVGQDLWVGPNQVESVKLTSDNTVRTVLDFVFAHTGSGGEMKTKVDAGGKPVAQAQRAMKFRAAYRLVLVDNQPWFTSRLLWIENTDTVPWTLGHYYHYQNSRIAGDAGNDDAKGSYWQDAKAGFNLGMVAEAPIDVSFWKDPAGGEHPDAARKLMITLKPGERYPAAATPPEPTVWVIGETAAAWPESLRALARHRAVTVTCFPVEPMPP